MKFRLIRSFAEGIVGLAVVGSGMLMLAFNAPLLVEGHSHPKIIFSIVIGALVFLGSWVVLIRPKRKPWWYFISGLMLLPSIIAIAIGNKLVMAGVIMPPLWNTTTRDQFMVLGSMFTILVLGLIICFFHAYPLWRKGRLS